jgi:glycosyltransferase involved in cell wall biosynthesis
VQNGVPSARKASTYSLARLSRSHNKFSPLGLITKAYAILNFAAVDSETQENLMKPHPVISVIVPCYNAARYIGALCESIQKQTFQEFEVLVLDDGSADSSFEVARTFSVDRRFIVERKEQNRGVGPRTAELLQKARGEFWANPGADDLIDPDFLAKRLAGLRAHPNASLIHGPARLIDQNGDPIPDSPHRPQNFLSIPPIADGKRLVELLLMHNVINTPSILVRMEPTRRILPKFDDRWQFAQDWFLWLLLASLNLEFVYDGLMLNSYRIHPESLTRLPAKAARRAAEIRLVPLSSLSAAQEFSATAKAAWTRWRIPLYALWLRRAALLQSRQQLDSEWVQVAIRAFYGETSGYRSLASELLRYAGKIAWASLRDRRVRKRISFPVAGLAEVNDPAFR